MAGNLFGTTRTVQPGVSAAPDARPSASTSGGVIASWPSQNGQVAASAMRVVRPSAPGPGRPARRDHDRNPREGAAAQIERYPASPPGRRARSRSIGIGRMVVVLFVPEISSSVCR